MPEDKTRVSYGAVCKMMDKASTEEAVLKGKTLIVAYEFEELGGWTVRGEASVVDQKPGIQAPSFYDGFS